MKQFLRKVWDNVSRLWEPSDDTPYTIGLLIICAVAVVLRIAIPAHAVFSNGVINFLGPDSYWRMNNARLFSESGHYGFNYDTLLAIMGNASIIIPVILGVVVIVLVYFMAGQNKTGLFAAVFSPYGRGNSWRGRS